MSPKRSQSPSSFLFFLFFDLIIINRIIIQLKKKNMAFVLVRSREIICYGKINNHELTEIFQLVRKIERGPTFNVIEEVFKNLRKRSLSLSLFFLISSGALYVSWRFLCLPAQLIDEFLGSERAPRDSYATKLTCDNVFASRPRDFKIHTDLPSVRLPRFSRQSRHIYSFAIRTLAA